MSAAKVQATIIYQDDFMGGTIGTDLKSSVPDVRLGTYGGSASAAWSATTGDWLFNGAGVSNTNKSDKSFTCLPFSPVSNAVYTLDWTWTAGSNPWWIIGTRHNGWDYSSVAGLSSSRTGTNHVVVTITTDGANGYTTHTVYNGTLASTNDTSGSRSNITCIGLIQQAGGSNTTVMKSLLLTDVPATPAASYATWAAAQTPPLTGGPSAVGPDGLPNLLIYALDLKTDGTNGSPGTLTGNQLSFTKRPEAVTNNDVTYAIEVSADLGVNDVWPTTTTGVTNAVGPPATISIDLSTLGGSTHFARLVVTQK